MTDSIPQGWLVEVQTLYINQGAQINPPHHFFLYNITISNKSSSSAQLISRYWNIAEDNGKIKEVSGKGVVGEQPVIHPDCSFSYTSGSDMESGGGIMSGYYILLTPGKQQYKLHIPPFALIRPDKLN